MPRFEVGFYNDDALRDYRSLDGSVRRLADVGIAKLAERADELGDALSGELAGCRKLKWRRAGIRMVYRVSDAGEVEIVEIVAIGRREGYG